MCKINVKYTQCQEMYDFSILWYKQVMTIGFKPFAMKDYFDRVTLSGH